MDTSELVGRLRHHAPDETAQKAHGAWREECLRFALELNRLLPDGREKSLAVTRLEETVMWGSKAVARGALPLEPRPAQAETGLEVQRLLAELKYVGAQRDRYKAEMGRRYTPSQVRDAQTAEADRVTAALREQVTGLEAQLALVRNFEEQK